VSSQVHPGRPGLALGHPLRVALLGLLAHRATLTSTEAARELGESSGACSFHLRQLARYGHVEEVPGARGRARPWRLATAAGRAGDRPPGSGPAGGEPAGGEQAGGDEFGALARELENEGYRRWLSHRDAAPPGWRDEAFSTVLHLTPEELAEVAAAIRGVIAAYAGRPEAGPGRPGAGGGGILPVAVVARMFPLLPADADPAGPGSAAPGPSA
jgi:Helix-turn-helix domain